MQVSRKKVQASFARATASYNEAAVVQNEILQRALAKLLALRPQNGKVLDLGSGTGLARAKLQELYGQDAYFAVDLVFAMLTYANQQFAGQLQHSVCGDAESLPYRAEAFDVFFSTSTLQWCNRLDLAFQEANRVLNTGGLLLFSTFGPDTLKELRASFAQVDENPHVKTFIDLHDIGDLLAAAGFSEVVMESETLTVEYSKTMQLLRDLQATGATNHLVDRSRGLLGKQQFHRVLKHYEQFKLKNGKFPASYEVIYGHGWKIAPSALESKEQWQPVTFKPRK